MGGGMMQKYAEGGTLKDHRWLNNKEEWGKKKETRSIR